MKQLSKPGLTTLLFPLILSIPTGSTSNHRLYGRFCGLCSGQAFDFHVEVKSLNHCQHICNCNKACKYYSFQNSVEGPHGNHCYLYNSLNCDMNNLSYATKWNLRIKYILTFGNNCKWISGVSRREFCRRNGRQGLYHKTRIN